MTDVREGESEGARGHRRLALAFAPVTWRRTGHLLLGLPAGLMSLGALLVVVPFAGLLAATRAGLPTVPALLAVPRRLAALERRRALLVSGRPIEAAYRPGASGGLAARVRGTLHDPQTLRDLGWLGALVVVGSVGAVLALGALVPRARRSRGVGAPAHPAGRSQRRHRAHRPHDRRARPACRSCATA